MSKSSEVDADDRRGQGPLKVWVHVNPMYIVVTQKPPGQTISVQVNIKNADGSHSTVSIPSVQVGTTVINTSASTESAACELIVVADEVEA